MRPRMLVASLLICAGAFSNVPAVAAADPAAPAWAIEAVPYPTSFEAGAAYDATKSGPAYLLQAYNVGGAPTSGTFTLVDNLPKGLLPAPGFPPTGYYGPQEGESSVLPMSCSSLGRKVTCTGGSEGPVGPGEGVSVVVPVAVDASASGPLLDKATIEGGGASLAETTTPTAVGAAPSLFGFISGPGLHGSATDAEGRPQTLAGSHPYEMTVAAMNLATNRNDLNPLLAAGGGLREAVVELPRGTVVDPMATPRCSESQLESGEVGCPDASQVGTIMLSLSLGAGFGQGPKVHPLYNMVPPPGYPAELGFEVIEGSYVHLLGSVSSDGTFTLTAKGKDVLARVAIGGVRTTLWGEPSDQSHDGQRGSCLISFAESECATERTRGAFLTMPAACSGPLETSARISSWRDERATGTYEAPTAIEDCEALRFDPAISAQPSTHQADSPSGLEFGLHQPQNLDYEDEAGEPQRATAPLKDATIVLPEGMAVNPSAANGRQACAADQVGLLSPIGQAPVRFREEPARCPDASNLGDVEVVTPLLDHTVSGSVYLAAPFDNPFGSLLGLYLVIEDEESGIIAKLAGKVEADPATGQLTASFAENPELPLENVRLSLTAGPRAALTTPLTCGQKATTGTLRPWSSPAPAAVSDSFSIDSAPGDAHCSGSEAAAPTGFGFTAGTADPLAGAYSPFTLRLTRPDGSQHITAIDATLPEGLIGRLAGIPYCPEAAIAQAQGRSNPEEGREEIASPSCPAASEVGTVTVGAGSGPSPTYVTGHAYLAGPYKGAPLSLAIVTPAVAGPFDLGVVVVRAALEVNLETAQITAKSDPLPTILHGIPLDVRSIALRMGRPGFTLNPTDCEASAVRGSVSTAAGGAVPVASRFQVGGCGALPFKPKLKLQLKGGTTRTAHPALKAVLTMPPGGANVARAQVGLPHSEFLDQGNLGNVCLQADLKAGTCPASSVYGHAKAWSPLLAQPLEGPVYLGVGFGHTLPDLVADLNGQIRILLHGKVDTTKKKGLRNTFEVVPDAPVSRFVLQMKGGKKYGLLNNSESLCRRTQRASVRFVAQNGKVAQLHPKIANGCGKGKKRRHKKHKRHGRR